MLVPLVSTCQRVIYGMYHGHRGAVVADRYHRMRLCETIHERSMALSFRWMVG